MTARHPTLRTRRADVSLLCGLDRHPWCRGFIRPLWGPPTRPCRCPCHRPANRDTRPWTTWDDAVGGAR